LSVFKEQDHENVIRSIIQGSLRMSKIKMRCTTCGKWFQSANAKEVICPDCVQKARREKLAAKNAPASTEKPAGTGVPTRAAPPPPPKPAASGTSHWFDNVSDVKIGEPDAPPQRPKFPSSPAPREPREPRESREPYEQRGPGGYREGGYRPGGPGGYRDERGPAGYRPGGPGGYRPGGYRDERGPAGYRPGGPGTLDTPGYRPRQPMEGGPGRGPRPGGPYEPRPDDRRGGKPQRAKTSKPATPPKPKREKIPPPTPFVATAEQIAQIEARYAELAVPQEFDGIRTQIAQELGIPKKAVKKAVQVYRAGHDLPSWWDTQSYKGDSEELAKIKAAYEPYLPVPPVGIHKQIADELALKAGDVYQAVKAIRQEMNLPQFNDPALHAEELAARQKQREAEKLEKLEKQKAAKAEAGVNGAEALTASDDEGQRVEDTVSAESTAVIESGRVAEGVESTQSTAEAESDRAVGSAGVDEVAETAAREATAQPQQAAQDGAPPVAEAGEEQPPTESAGD
jgi:hypothetical protein